MIFCVILSMAIGLATLVSCGIMEHKVMQLMAKHREDIDGLYTMILSHNTRIARVELDHKEAK